MNNCPWIQAAVKLRREHELRRCDEGCAHIMQRLLALCIVALLTTSCCGGDNDRQMLNWQALPDLPDALGVAGPFVGIHKDALIVAGGANFDIPVWENDKTWHDAIYVLTKSPEGKYVWQNAGRLHKPLAYGASVSCKEGVLCIGGNDNHQTFADVFLLQWDPATRTVQTIPYPSLPEPCAYGSAALIDNTVYVFGGQSNASLESASSDLWALDLPPPEADAAESKWRRLPSCPGPPRAFHLTVAQHNGYDNCVYVISGRRQRADDVAFLRDVWEFTPRTGAWRQRADVPVCVMAGTGIGFGQSHIFVFGGADGTLFHRTDELRDAHPGFPRQAWAYHTITDTWTSAGSTPKNHVTTTAVRWNEEIIIPSGEIRPRVRTAHVWKVRPIAAATNFGTVNYLVVTVYLLAMVWVGVWFAQRTQDTDDFFRGGQKIPWWAAGCSIFATMLSSLTYTGLPAKSYAQDWVYAVGNMMIPVVAIAAVFVALPFFRRIDATSAYEYLELRFNRAVRLFGSASFTLFHVFRMAVVMSLTALALAVATGMTPSQSVLLMGVLSILYCTLGGIEAVVWTDTLQTLVLLGGAIAAITILILGVDGGLSGFWSTAVTFDKLRLANLHWDVTSSQVALWVIIVGGLAQNISSYTADQAVVQRYMTTPDEKRAARSIWTNAVLTIPATVLFFGMGTALFVWYRQHPDHLDPTITTDQIFPLFIARELPAGLSGLIVAGIFAAAQSTVSTSMNSTSTAVVTDFLRPFQWFQSERSYLRAARCVTVVMGIAGTGFALLFVDPEIRSLFDAFLKVIGMFMGVLGGLFLLGVLSTRANASGALTGAVFGTIMMVVLWRYTAVNAYLYTFTGIAACVVVGFLTSMVVPAAPKDLTGLTVFSMPKSPAADAIVPHGGRDET